MPADTAICAAMLDGADTAATIGMRAIHAFCVISKPARPLTITTWRSSVGRQAAAPEHVTDDLVPRVVATDVLAQHQQAALQVEEPGGVGPAGTIEGGLGRTHGRAHPGEARGGHHRVAAAWWARGADGVD